MRAEISFSKAGLSGRMPLTVTSYCTSESHFEMMPDRVAGEINELAMDAMGDVIIEEDLSLVPDYADEITEVLRIKEE